MPTVFSTIDDEVSKDIFPPADDWRVREWNSGDSDNRVKLFFLGNWPKTAECTELHFLITPRGYEPGVTPGTHGMMYFSISPYHAYVFTSNEGAVRQVQARKGTYLIFEDLENKKPAERIIPFIFRNSPDYKLCPKSMESTLRDIKEEIWKYSLGQDNLKADAEQTIEREEARDNVEDSISETYMLLKSSFSSSLNRNPPARWSELNPEDWLKRRFPLDAPGRIVDYVRDLIGWIVQR